MKFSDVAPGLDEPLRGQVRRFYDGGLPARDGVPEVAPNPDRDPIIMLERLTERSAEVFSMPRRIAYRDRHSGEILVPADLDSFRTDLTSVPAAFTWLVPKTGAHLPAALLHDGLVDDGEAKSYLSREGHVIDRAHADRIFRDAMADTGTGLVRRWIIWSAVTLATIFSNGVPSWTPVQRWSYRAAAALTIIVITYLGYSATADLFDVHWPLAISVPWMAERPFWMELVSGAAGAIVFPLLLGLTWGRFRVAGIINGIALALLLHVTLGVVAISSAYVLIERAVRRWPMPMAGVAALVVAASAGLVITLVVT